MVEAKVLTVYLELSMDVKSLTSFTFERGENYTYIPAVFLSKSINLPSFLFPETIKKIGNYAFKD